MQKYPKTKAAKIEEEANPATEVNILAELELSYKYKNKKKFFGEVGSSLDAAAFLRSVWNAGNIEYLEEFLILCLNRANKIIGWVKISTGGVSGVIVDPKVVFAAALQSGASAIVLCHNHPSGNLQPSSADINLTHKFKEAGKYLDIEVLDHIILTESGYYSFTDSGMLF